MLSKIWAEFVSAAERGSARIVIGRCRGWSALVALACFGTACTGGAARESPRPAVGTVRLGSLPATTPDVTVASTTALPQTPTSTPTSTPTASPAPGSASTSQPPPEQTGVPGLDDADPLCSAWSRYVASIQVVTVAANFGGLTELELARIELIAAPAVLRAVDDLAASFPGSLGAERIVVFDDLVGPFDRRAEKAAARLATAGIDEAGIEVLVDRWLAVLRERDPEQPVPVVDLADVQFATSIEQAATDYVGDVTTWTRDPSLDVGHVEVPLTVAVLADRCPDLSTVGVGDAI